ncbi:hypothetical protein C8R45DRAFT_932604 [Mycena sanguinolenta]|nr:hypothetical protein C8R45DRAFT_932604 [Mycena sanguinolenta]
MLSTGGRRGRVMRCPPSHAYEWLALGSLREDIWRRLDREGRAIYPVVYAHAISVDIVAKVFAVSEDTIMEPLQNKLTNQDSDKVENDYCVQTSSSNKKDVDGSQDPRSAELDEVSQKRTKRGQNAPPPPEMRAHKIPVPVRTAMQVPREIPVVEIPVRSKVDPEAAAIKRFLKNDAFKEKGLRTMGDLRTLAGLEEARLVKTLTRLFGDKMAEVHILLLVDALLDLSRMTLERIERGSPFLIPEDPNA